MWLFIQTEKAEHILDPYFETFKTPHLRIRAEGGVMATGHGNISVDGEILRVVEHCGFDVVSHPNMLSLLI
jgi:hypothetical protein